MTDSNSDQFNDPYAFSEEHQDSVVLSRKASKRVKITKEVSSVTKALKMDVDPQPESSDQLTHELDAHKHEMCTIGVETESAYLGPCEPGTSVVLEGIVWHESDSGILVINVTWRGKKYIGTLLDSSRHEWAPPNFSPNNTAGSTVKEKSPVKLRGRRGRGGKRTVPAPHRSPRKWSSTASVSSEPGKSSDEMKPSTTVDTSVTCSEAKCSKKFRGVNCKDALEYHKIHAHASSSMVSVSDMDNASDKKGTEKMDSSVKAEVKTESELNVKAEVKVDNSEKHQNIGASNLQSSNVANDNKLRENAVLRSVNQTNSKSIEFASKSSSSTVSSSNKKINTPVAVLRPLVPQQMSSQDGKPMSSNPSQTMNVPRIIPQNRNSINLPQVPRTDFMSNAQQFVPNNSNLQVINRHHFPGIIPSSQTVAPNSNNRNVPFFPPGVHMAAPVPNVRTTERSQGRNSLTYSDISDASDQEGEVTHRQAVRNPNRGNRDPSIEDRLFCSEELTANSPPLNNANQNTGVQYSPSISSTTASNTPVKSNNNALPGNNASKPAGATTFCNTNLTPPPHMLTTQPQPVMYPYLPFMQTTQVPGCSVSFHPPPAAPIYAATPYLMTYAGMPQFIQPQQQYGNVPNPNQQFHRMPVTEPNVPTSKTN